MATRRTWVGGFAILVATSLTVTGCGTNGSGSSGASTPDAGGSAPAASAPVVSAPLWPEPGAGDLPDSSTAALQKALDGWVESAGLDGATAAVVTSAGVWSGAAGVDAAGTPLQPDSAMSIMSISKTYTAAEVMLLAGRGLVDLDAPITDYIDVPFDTQGATVRQVLAMRSGFPDYTTEASQTAQAADLDREWTVTEALATLPEDAEGLGTVGGPPRYNSVNYQLLAELVAKVTTKTFAQAVREDLLDPAGLQGTWVQTGETPIAPLTVGGPAKYADIVDPAGPFMPSRSFASFAIGTGNMAADAADTALWGYQLYGGQAIDSTLVTQLEADAQPDLSGLPYALGTQVLTDDSGATFVGHAGGGPEWPYTGSLSVWTADPQVAVAVLTPQPADFPTQIYDLVMQLHNAATE